MLKKNTALALIFYLASGSSFLSCNQKPEEAPARAGQPPAYFNVQGFLQEQLQYLQRANPAVVKTVTNGTLPPEQETLKQVNWEKELAFFLDADINKDAWRNTYQGDTIIDKSTGTRLYTYQSPNNSKAPVKLVQVETLANNRVKTVRLVTRQHNPLFFAGRTLTITCNPLAPENYITSYTINGVQKPVFADSLRYSVSAKLLYHQYR